MQHHHNVCRQYVFLLFFLIEFAEVAAAAVLCQFTSAPLPPSTTSSPSESTMTATADGLFYTLQWFDDHVANQNIATSADTKTGNDSMLVDNNNTTNTAAEGVGGNVDFTLVFRLLQQLFAAAQQQTPTATPANDVASAGGNGQVIGDMLGASSLSLGRYLSFFWELPILEFLVGMYYCHSSPLIMLCHSATQPGILLTFSVCPLSLSPLPCRHIFNSTARATTTSRGAVTTGTFVLLLLILPTHSLSVFRAASVFEPWRTE